MKQKRLLLSKGTFGFIYLSIWNDRVVAIKKPRYDDDKTIQIFMQEIAIHQTLDHPNIVTFLGVLNESKPVGFILEHIQGGDLFDMMKRAEISYKCQLSIAIDFAHGLDYLHGLRIIHRDLKLENILIDSHNNTLVAKICDFGLAGSLDNDEMFKGFCGTIGYVAPELFEKKAPYPYSTHSDTYAYAQILGALLRRSIPFVGCNRQFVISGKRDKIPENTPVEYAELIAEGWAQDPGQRPSMVDMLIRLSTLATKTPELFIKEAECIVDSVYSLAKKTTENPHAILLDYIEKLRLYGQTLVESGRAIAGKKTMKLANDLQVVVHDLNALIINETDATIKMNSHIQAGTKTMGEDRQWKDIIAHFLLDLLHNLSKAQNYKFLQSN